MTLARAATWLRSLARATGLAASDVGRHPVMAVVSLALALGTWAIVEEVDNPRVEGRAPAGGGLEPLAVNVPEGFLVGALPVVSVQVRAREDDLPGLRPEDFEARVNLEAWPPGQREGTAEVRVRSRRRDVEVLRVEPREVQVSLVAAAQRELRVSARVTQGPPSGLVLDESIELSPSVVQVSGPAPLVARADRVELNANLASAREGTAEVEGELVAVAADGSLLALAIEPARGKAVFRLNPTLATRTIGLQGGVTGKPAAGFVVTSVTVDPPLVQVAGPRSTVDSLQAPLLVERVDVTGARAGLQSVRTLTVPGNVTIDRQTVVVSVEIQALECSAGTAAACEPATVFVPLTVTDIPAGLAVEATAALTVQVRVSGPLATIGALKPGDITATVSLATATAGTVALTPRVVAPAGVRVEGVEQVSLTLRSTGAR